MRSWRGIITRRELPEASGTKMLTEEHRYEGVGLTWNAENKLYPLTVSDNLKPLSDDADYFRFPAELLLIPIRLTDTIPTEAQTTQTACIRAISPCQRFQG